MQLFSIGSRRGRYIGIGQWIVNSIDNRHATRDITTCGQDDDLGAALNRFGLDSIRQLNDALHISNRLKVLTFGKVQTGCRYRKTFIKTIALFRA